MITRQKIEELSMSDGQTLPTDLEHLISAQEDASLRSPGVPAHYYRFLYRLVQFIQPRFTLELGTWHGQSSACLAEGFPAGHVITVNNQDELDSRCKRANVIYRIHDSLEAFAYQDLPIDILFIDTCHDGMRCELEFNLFHGSVRPGGVILFDDISLNEEMWDFWRDFKPEGFEKFELQVHGDAGFGVLIKNEAQEAQS